MNWLQRLLGIDKLIEAMSNAGNQQVDELKKQLQEQKMQSEERERELREQLQQKLSQTQEQKPDGRDIMIKQLEEQLKAVQLVQKSPREALAEYFKAQNQVEETKRKPGRPRIEAKRFEMLLELDIAIILEEVARSQKKSLAKLINETMRNYLYDSYSELFEDLNKPQDADDPRQMHFEFGQED